MARVCVVEDCGRRSHGANQHCESHRWRLRVHGDVFADIPIGSLRFAKPVEMFETAAERERRFAYAPTPAEGRGLLWLV